MHIRDSSKRTKRAFACLLLAASVGIGCKDDGACVAGLSDGQRYQVELVSNYTTASPYTVDDATLARMTLPTCAPPFGRSAGDTFDFKATGVQAGATSGASCGFWVGGPYRLPGVGFGAEVTSFLPADVHDLLQTANEVSIAGCQGVLNMELVGPDGGDIFREPKTGELPPLVLLYQLRMGVTCAALPAPCQQLWVVRLTRA